MDSIKKTFHCKLCNKEASNGILLLDGSIIHKSCYLKFLNYNPNQLQNIKNLKESIEDMGEHINMEKYSLGHILLSIFSLENKDLKNLEEQLLMLNNKLDEAYKKYHQYADKVNKILFNIHNYWPERPPDWETRRDKIISRDLFCQRCYEEYGKNYKTTHHVHLKIPLKSGGTHNLSNLELLCESCHQHVHHNRKLDEPGKELYPFKKKIGTIKKAIDEELLITFNYRRYDGAKSHRSIEPHEFLRKGSSLCVRGYCHLRQKIRIFAIKRMSSLSIS